MDSNLYSILNKSWKSFSSIVLKGDLGDLEGFLDFIKRVGTPIKYSTHKRGVMLAPQFYKFIWY